MSAGLNQQFQRLDAVIRDTHAWLGATEVLWLTASTSSSIRSQLGPPQLEALHESAFLRIFGAWEAFQEEATARFMAGHSTTAYTTRLPGPQYQHHSSVSSARTQLLSGRPFLLWHNPDAVIKRVARYLDSCPVETVIDANKIDLEHYGSIRHRIAHSSDDAKVQFKQAARFLTGVDYGGVAGRMLRAHNIADGLNQRLWIVDLSEALRGIAADIVA
jgi:hypothetical protein